MADDWERPVGTGPGGRGAAGGTGTGRGTGSGGATLNSAAHAPRAGSGHRGTTQDQARQQQSVEELEAKTREHLEGALRTLSNTQAQAAATTAAVAEQGESLDFSRKTTAHIEDMNATAKYLADGTGGFFKSLKFLFTSAPKPQTTTGVSHDIVASREAAMAEAGAELAAAHDRDARRQSRPTAAPRGAADDLLEQLSTGLSELRDQQIVNKAEIKRQVEQADKLASEMDRLKIVKPRA